MQAYLHATAVSWRWFWLPLTVCWHSRLFVCHHHQCKSLAFQHTNPCTQRHICAQLHMQTHICVGVNFMTLLFIRSAWHWNRLHTQIYMWVHKRMSVCVCARAQFALMPSVSAPQIIADALALVAKKLYVCAIYVRVVMFPPCMPFHPCHGMVSGCQLLSLFRREIVKLDFPLKSGVVMHKLSPCCLNSNTGGLLQREQL